MKNHKEYLYGIVVGALLVFVPWWVSILAVAAIITYLVMSSKDHDKPFKAQDDRKGAKKKAAAIQHASCNGHCRLEEGEYSWDYL